MATLTNQILIIHIFSGQFSERNHSEWTWRRIDGHNAYRRQLIIPFHSVFFCCFYISRHLYSTYQLKTTNSFYIYKYEMTHTPTHTHKHTKMIKPKPIHPHFPIHCRSHRKQKKKRKIQILC